MLAGLPESQRRAAPSAEVGSTEAVERGVSEKQPIHGTTLRERTAKAAADKRLQASLRRAADTFAERTASAHAAFSDGEELRRLARSIKADILRRLPDVLARLADRVQARGGSVCWAHTAAEANQYVADVAKRIGAKSAVKSKSMASEEIGLNQALEAEGCQVTETDLGEWIIQLANEMPSHIIVPAIHRDRGQIAEVLSRVAGGDLSDVPEDLAAFARERLRAKFLAADLGISGVNFGIAETGTCVLVTNEGNGRLVTSLPRVHVAIMGMERVLDSWEQLDLFLALLPRAATGQAITTYTSFINGTRAADEVDGPDEFHLVILDNGRSEILGSDVSEMLACIRCGACLNVCPVYRQIGGHAYGWVYSGPMGAVLTPLLADAKEAAELSQASTLCGACWQACPVGIPLQDLLLALRRRSASDAGRIERAGWRAWAAAWSRPAAYRASLRAGGAVRGLASMGVGFGGWSAGRELPELPKQAFRELWEKGKV